jgi:hypothetical protein
MAPTSFTVFKNSVFKNLQVPVLDVPGLQAKVAVSLGNRNFQKKFQTHEKVCHRSESPNRKSPENFRPEKPTNVPNRKSRKIPIKENSGKVTGHFGVALHTETALVYLRDLGQRTLLDEMAQQVQSITQSGRCSSLDLFRCSAKCIE